MSAPGGFVPDVIIFVPVRFIPPDDETQAVFEQYIAVRSGATPAEIRAAAEDWLENFLATERLDKYRPRAALGEYRTEILAVTAIHRASSGQRGY